MDRTRGSQNKAQLGRSIRSILLRAPTHDPPLVEDGVPVSPSLQSGRLLSTVSVDVPSRPRRPEEKDRGREKNGKDSNLKGPKGG